jgi:hypothetical protein
MNIMYSKNFVPTTKTNSHNNLLYDKFLRELRKLDNLYQSVLYYKGQKNIHV